MKMIQLVSSVILAVGHDGYSLRVVFHHGGIHDHPGVPEWMFHELVRADSPGGYYNRHIRGRFR